MIHKRVSNALKQVVEKREDIIVTSATSEYVLGNYRGNRIKFTTTELGWDEELKDYLIEVKVNGSFDA